MSELKTSTSLTPVATLPIPTEGKPTLSAKPNMLKLPSHDAVMAQAEQAWQDDVISRHKNGTATQRMAWAIMCEYARKVIKSESGTISRLSDILTSKDAKSDMIASMVDIFVPALPDTDNKAGEDNRAAVVAQRNHRQLIIRSLELAACLTAFNVPFMAFNTANGFFSVPPAMLTPKNSTPIDRLAELKAIPLDGSSVIFIGKDKNGKAKPGSAQASVAQVRSICMPSTKRQGSNAAGDTAAKPETAIDGGKASIPAIAKAIPLAKLIGAVHDLLITNAPDKRAPLKHDALSSATWNQLTAIATLMDRSTAAWQAEKTKQPAVTAKIVKVAAKKAA